MKFKPITLTYIKYLSDLLDNTKDQKTWEQNKAEFSQTIKRLDRTIAKNVTLECKQILIEMIHITEDKLKAAIQICLGGDSIYTEKREANLVHDIKALSIADVGRSFSEKEIKDFVIKLRKKHRAIEEKQFFCNDHNFKLEAEAKRSEAEVVRRIIHEMENEFDLGFVWDDSLND